MSLRDDNSWANNHGYCEMHDCEFVPLKNGGWGCPRCQDD
jgi:hypothetical protein